MSNNTRVLMGFRPRQAEWSQPEAGVCLVTGGAGFIGARLTARLAEDGFRVRVLDDFSTGSRASLSRPSADVEMIEGDVRDPAVCRAACQDAAVVFHLAARVSVEESLRDPAGTGEVNVGGTIHLLEAARACGVKRFVFGSSALVYGDTPVLPKEETMEELPESPFAASKVAAEKFCTAYERRWGLSTVVLRIFNAYGPTAGSSSASRSLIPSVIRSLRDGRPPAIQGEGNQTRDFVHVDDVVEACLLGAWTTEASGERFNIGSGGRTSVRDVVASLSRLVPGSPRPVFLPAREGDTRDSQASIQKARRILGFRPAGDLETGLGELVSAGD